MYERISKLLGTVSWILLIFTIFSFIIDIIYSSDFAWKINKVGVTNFIALFSNTVKSAIGFLGVLTLYVASKKLNVSATQTELIQENNKFNNYFKHREYYFDHLSKSTIVSKFSNESQVDPYYSLSFTYTYFYRSDYRLFTPNIKQSAKDVIGKYVDAKNELVEKWKSIIVAPKQIEPSILNDLFSENKSIIEEQVKFLVRGQKEDIIEYWQNEISQGNKYAHDPHTAADNFELFAIFYWTLCLFNDVLVFDSAETIIMEDMNDIFDDLHSFNGLS